MFNVERTLVPYSHVNMYGHLEMGTTKLKLFLDYKLVPKKKSSEAVQGRSMVMEKLAEAALNEMYEKEDEKEDEEEDDQKIDPLLEYLGAEDDTNSKTNELNGVKYLLCHKI